MDHQVTARRFRPQRFAEVVGQEAIVRTLLGGLARGRIAHGYLFSGPRGVGKTTTARLLAKALNCAAPEAGEPCNRCPACSEVAEGRFVDVIEIDGASNTGVDNIRDLREQVAYLPAMGRYKVYVIDEVHMLSKGAFNALLKTLEEPPPHVVFVFATTELHKVPATIVSRCQRYEFHRIREAEIVAQLQRVATAYAVATEEQALWEIAVAASGSLRDAESLFDQVVAFGACTCATVHDLLGLVDRGVLSEAVAHIAAKDGGALLRLVDELVGAGYMFESFLKSLAEQVRHLLVMRVVGESTPLVTLAEAQRRALLAAGAPLTDDQLGRALALLTDTGQALHASPFPRFTLEAGLLRLLRLEPVVTIEQLLERLAAGETTPPAAPPAIAAAPGAPGGHRAPPPPAGPPRTPPPAAHPSAARRAPRPAAEPVAPPHTTPPASTREAAPSRPPAAPAAPRDGGATAWPEVIAALTASHPGVAALLERARLGRCDGAAVELLFPPASFELAEVETRREVVEAAVRQRLGEAVRLVIREGEGGAPSLAEQRNAHQAERKRRLVVENPRVVEAVATFDGAIVDVELAEEEEGFDG
ncbi:MAG: DNA polymerase III subunit gamma/tau [Deltaproteobacteria bacterium]|nr:DNA polymerase III subunit gamma/tau [Deltaproteobacteria bacterium]NCP95477.1 DNA polymerase III subunit gamma/tau [Deltaproteobacteria bacterium]